MRPDIVDGSKSSAHPLAPGRFYTGVIRAVDANGLVSVYVLELGSTYNRITPLNTTPNSHFSVGDAVKCTFSDEFFTELIVVGSSKIRDNMYPTMAQYTALLAIVNDLVDRVETLEGA